MTRRLLMAFAGAGVAVPALLVAAQWPSYWVWVASEQTPMTWFQSVVLVLTSAACLLVAFVRPEARRSWLVLGTGFGSLALDERFALHERLRDSFLAPRGVSLPFLPWVGPGDFLILAVAVVGLLVARRLWVELSADSTSSMVFGVAVLLAVVAVGMDSVDPAAMSIGVERLEQTLEECVELWSGLCFLAAVLIRLLGELPGDNAAAQSRVATTAIW